MVFNLDNWKKDSALMTDFFNEDEIFKIADRLKKLRLHNVVYCCFENRFAKSGGLAAVTNNILPYLKESNNIPLVILVTPFYPKIIDETKLKSTGIYFDVPYDNKTIPVELYENTWNYSKPENGSLKEYYLKAEGFFEAQNKLNDPYIYHENDKQLNQNTMNENVLFFCQAVPLVLKALNIREDIIFHLQEWQTALISLTSKEAVLNGTLESCGTVQTMHNSFDSFISRDLLANIVDESRRQRISDFMGNGLTAYQIGLQLVDGPITTVSENFAKEFTSDIFQTKHFAPILLDRFKKSGVYGVNNGMFIDFSSEFPKREKHTPDEIRKIKLKNRNVLLKVLDTHIPDEMFGKLTYKGKTITNLPDNIPIIVMSGRLDPVQKGYDILLRAIERFAEDEIKVILTPMPVKHSDLDFFYEVAYKCKGNITVFPVRMEEGFHELQTGSTFGIMPSIYEPFGAAVEYMVNGTVNIARATGGLVDQIDDKCGFLYKEDASFYNLKNIKDFVKSSNIVQMRKTNKWVQSMTDKLYETLKNAIDLYQNSQEEYFKLIIEGFKKAQIFTWEINAKKYFKVYEKVK